MTFEVSSCIKFQQFPGHPTGIWPISRWGAPEIVEIQCIQQLASHIPGTTDGDLARVVAGSA